MGKNKHTYSNDLPNFGDAIGIPPVSKEYARWMMLYYKTHWPDDFERDRLQGFPGLYSDRRKTHFDWRGNAEAFRLFKPIMLELFSEKSEGDLEAHILGIGVPSGKLELKKKLSEAVYFLLELRNKKVMGAGMLLQKLLHKCVIDKDGLPLKVTSVLAQIGRIERKFLYPQNVAELDEHIDEIAKVLGAIRK